MTRYNTNISILFKGLTKSMFLRILCICIIFHIILTLLSSICAKFGMLLDFIDHANMFRSFYMWLCEIAKELNKSAKYISQCVVEYNDLEESFNSTLYHVIYKAGNDHPEYELKKELEDLKGKVLKIKNSCNKAYMYKNEMNNCEMSVLENIKRNCQNMENVIGTVKDILDYMYVEDFTENGSLLEVYQEVNIGHIISSVNKIVPDYKINNGTPVNSITKNDLKSMLRIIKINLSNKYEQSYDIAAPLLPSRISDIESMLSPFNPTLAEKLRCELEELNGLHAM